MTAPLTVLHAYSGNLYGGVERILSTLARHPGNVGHRFVLCYEGLLAGELRGVGAQVAMVGKVRFRWPWTVLAARRRFADIIGSQRPSAVLCHSPWALAVFGPAARARGVPLVLWAHDAFTGRPWLERLARLTALPDIGICNSQHTRAAFSNAFPNIPTEVVYAPVAPPPTFDPARRPPKREGHGASPNTVVVALVARLERWKGHVALLNALAALRDQSMWTAWIVGGAQGRAEDVYRAELEQRANDARIADRVHFLGRRDDVASLLWASDIYCQPNTSPEPFGIAFVEALYAGLPVVTTDLGGAREIVTPRCGVLVPPGDSQALRHALGHMMTDADLRRKLGSAAPSRAAELCSPETAARRLAEVLTEVAGR